MAGVFVDRKSEAARRSEPGILTECHGYDGREVGGASPARRRSQPDRRTTCLPLNQRHHYRTRMTIAAPGYECSWRR